MTTTRPRVLIEDWLPIAELGIESRREAAPIPGQFPKIKTLHVWWARRPLAASAGTVLCSLLPAWSPELAARFDDPRLATEAAYRDWTLHLIGIWGDPIAAKQRITAATRIGKTLGAAAYGYKQAFKNSPSPSDLSLLHTVLESTWGSLPTVIDPTAGGGSIPYTAARYGLPSHANDLNPVAAAVLRAGVETTARYGVPLGDELRRWGELLVNRCAERLTPFFQLPDKSNNNSFIFARTVACPRTGKQTPLSPNWWLSTKGDDEAAVRVVTERDGIELNECEFEIVTGADAYESQPDDGTVSRGNGVSVWDGLPIDGDHIKAEAQAGRMGSQLYAVAVRYPNPDGGRSKWTRGFRAPTRTDLEALAAAEDFVRERHADWETSGVIPDEEIGLSNYERGHRMYGINRWSEMFSLRQLLVQAVFVEEWRRLRPEVEAELASDLARTVMALLGLMQGKALNWNSVGCTWMVGRQQIRSQFEKHNFAFRWAYAEFEGASELWPWCLSQLVDAYEGIAELYEPNDNRRALSDGTVIEPGTRADLDHPVPGPVTVSRANAATLPIETGSQTLVCIDPPYHDNVMYAELSDFFGVWEQQTIGDVWPGLMPGGLADTANEAVANVARFKDFGRRKKELANADYKAKMQAIFAEAYRVLRDDGVMTVMFTHKKAEAWDTLGTGLMQAGFEIATSWPVNTESTTSSHQMKTNSAASTIMLVCRKRPDQGLEMRFFEDLISEVKAAASDAVRRFEMDGIGGVDLLLSTYGPALSVISSAWPVYSSEVDEVGKARLLRPEEALDVAREELIQARRRALVGRQVTFDPITDFWLISWELFQAEEFPYDEARRLALAVGGQDPESLAAAGLLKKKSGSVVLQSPAERRRKVLRPVQDGEIDGMPLVDVLHGVMVIAEVDGLAAAKAAMDRLGLTDDSRFLALVQGSINALPSGGRRGRSSGRKRRRCTGWLRPTCHRLSCPKRNR
jgi:putative DNA methylase